jgi:uncharacterized protein YjdB
MKLLEQPDHARPYHASMSYVTGWLRAAIAFTALGVLGWLGGCSDTPGAPVCCDPLPQGLVISDPVPAIGVAQGSPVASALTTSAGDDVAYVSLPPGTVPTGDTAIIRRVGDSSLTTAVFGGGFDPVPVVAQAGDSIDVIVRDAAGGTVLQERLAVAAARPPIVVRSDPPREKTDVPLNAAIVIVFSEPVDAGTLTPSSVRLFRGTSLVAGTIALLQGTGALVGFVPTAPLSANTEYRLEVTTAVQDLDGDALPVGVTATFTTGQSSTGPAASLDLSPASFSVLVAQTFQMTATVRDNAGNILIDQPVTWFTGGGSQPHLSISTTGLVTALSGGGDSVFATLGGLTSSATAVVAEHPPASLEVSPVAATVAAGDTIILTATVRDTAGRSLSQFPVSWASGAPGLATVDSYNTGTEGFYGMVRGLSQGNVTVTATSRAVRGSAAITVGPAVPVASVTVAPVSATIVVSGTVQLTATLRDATGRVIGRPVTWASNNPSAAIVDANGLVTAVGGGGAAIIATSDGVSDNSNVTVTTVSLVSVRAGLAVSGGIATGGQAYWWGGDAGSPVPLTLPGGLIFTTISAGGDHLCALTAASVAYCWGSNAHGQLGTSSIGTVSPSPLQVLGVNINGVSAGSDHTCGLTTDSAAYCWGWNIQGQLGNGTTSGSGPSLVAGGLKFASLSAGGMHTCGLTGAGEAYCWGFWGTAFALVPTRVTGSLAFSALSAGDRHTCGIATDSLTYCWGLNGNGQLGDGTTVERPTPQLVAGGQIFVAVAAGTGHTCGITGTGVAHCWGNNSYGELGNGSTNSALAPVQVSGGLSFVTISALGSHTCGLTTDGGAYCWGRNYWSQLGDGTTIDRNVPVKVAGQP